MSHFDDVGNSFISFIENAWPVFNRLLLLALLALVVVGASLATSAIYSIYDPAAMSTWQRWCFLLSWPGTSTPLWWKVSFFTLGLLWLTHRILAQSD